MARLARWSRVLGSVLLAWSLVAALAALQSALTRYPDRMAEQDAEFRRFVADLPWRGTVGYLEPFDGFTDDSTRDHFTAQYSLVPRLVVPTLEHEFLIVANGAARPDGDPRLVGFVPAARLPGGHRLFRRFP